MPNHKEMTVDEMRFKLTSFDPDDVLIVRLGFPDGTPAEFIAAVITQIAVAHPNDIEGAIPIWSSEPEQRYQTEPIEVISDQGH